MGGKRFVAPHENCRNILYYIKAVSVVSVFRGTSYRPASRTVEQAKRKTAHVKKTKKTSRTVPQTNEQKTSPHPSSPRPRPSAVRRLPYQHVVPPAVRRRLRTPSIWPTDPSPLAQQLEHQTRRRISRPSRKQPPVNPVWVNPWQPLVSFVRCNCRSWRAWYYHLKAPAPPPPLFSSRLPSALLPPQVYLRAH